MWDHPITQVHLNTLNSWGWSVVSPVSKLLACKDTGNGALAEVETIVGTVRDSVASILQSESKTSNAMNTESFGIFLNILETKRNKIEKKSKNKDEDSCERLISYHTLFCLAINAFLFIGALTRGS